MKRILSVIAAVGLAVSCCLSASAIDQRYLDQITLDPMGKIYKIEVGTTVGEVKQEMASRGYTLSGVATSDNKYAVSDTQLVCTGFTSLIYATKSPTVTWMVTGDVNGDGEVDIADAQEVSKCLAAQSAGTPAVYYFTYPAYVAADADYDNEITIADVMEISKIIARHQND